MTAHQTRLRALQLSSWGWIDTIIYLLECQVPVVTGCDSVCWADLGALYVVVQVIPEGVNEVDGVVSGIGIGVTREQDWKHETSAWRLITNKKNKD